MRRNPRPDPTQAQPTLRIDAQRLEVLLSMRNMSKVELANKMGVHPNLIFRIKNVGTATFETMERLCVALECNPIDLLTWQGFPDPFWEPQAGR